MESFRLTGEIERKAAEAFVGWGIPTVQTLLWAREAAPGLLVFGSGGIRTGLDIAKIVGLGGDAAGMALPFLKAAQVSAEAVSNTIEELIRELKITMFCTSSKNLTALKNSPNLIRV